MPLLRRKKRTAPERDDYNATLESGILEGELASAPAGTFGKYLDVRTDIAAPVCAACDKPIEGEPPHIEQDGKPRHSACALHERFGCLGDSAEATHCKVCGNPLLSA